MSLKKFFAFIVFVFLSLLPNVFGQDKDNLIVDGKPDRSTPQRTVASFSYWLQQNEGKWRPEIAAQCLDLSHFGDNTNGPKLAIQLKRWLDAKGIGSYKAIPDAANYLDPKTQKPQYWLSNNEDYQTVYLIKSGDVWLFSSETVTKIPVLYRAEFPPLFDFALNHLPKVFQIEIPVISIKIWQLAGLFSLILMAFVLGRVARWILDHPLRNLFAKTQTTWDDLIFEAISKPLGWLVVAALLSWAFPLLLFASINKVATTIFGALAMFCFVWAAWRSAEAITNELKRRAELTDSQADDHLVFMAKIGLRILVFSLGIILMLQSFGIEVGTLVAGLGIGGLAVALAAQSILGDLFASLVIALDKPFILGDEIFVSGYQGTVEFLGLKTTRLKSVQGEQVILSNAEILKNPIRNFKRMSERREVFSFGVTYQTPSNKLEEIPKIIQEIVESTPNTRFERAHFKKFGDSSLDFETVFWMKTPRYKEYLDAQQKINLEIMRRFEKEKIEFAYPTRTLLIEKMPSAKAS